MTMNKINIEITAEDAVKALVDDGKVFNMMPVLRVDNAVIIDIDRFVNGGTLIFKTFLGSYQLTGYRIDTSNEDNKPEFKLERL
jgi:hypothetical protein